MIGRIIRVISVKGDSMYLIKDLPPAERPRERLVQHGAEHLSLAELIAIIFRTGGKDASAVAIAQEVVAQTPNLWELKDKTVAELARIKGVGAAKAISLLAAVELGRRISDYRGSDLRISSPKDAYRLLHSEVSGLKQEVLYALYLDARTNLIDKRRIFIGSLNQSLIHPREVFKYAVKYSAYQIVLVHNHPSGDPTPSPEDIAVTERFLEIGRLLQITLTDHVIIGTSGYISIVEHLHASGGKKRP